MDPETRRIPLPVWARYGLTQTGESAWEAICQDSDSFSTTQSYCMYIHIPFCESKCSFCDCYSFALRKNADVHRKAYGALLRQEIETWARLPSLTRRLISTIHFGGGTPVYLSLLYLQEIASALRTHFDVSPSTEWAIEITTSENCAEGADKLAEMGIRRIHFGVQTLADPVRQLIRRREPAQSVLEKVTNAVRTGQIVSVDLIFGLPGQTLTGFLVSPRWLRYSGTAATQTAQPGPTPCL
jgi:coproporphyrinogen III oxidase-like Fe-S oxidoreductase